MSILFQIYQNTIQLQVKVSLDRHFCSTDIGATQMELEIEKSELKRIKQIAHHIKPEFHIGKDGVSKAFMDSLMQGFNTKEVIKVKVLDNCSEEIPVIKIKLSDTKYGLTYIQKIGHVITLYKAFENKA